MAAERGKSLSQGAHLDAVVPVAEAIGAPSRLGPWPIRLAGVARGLVPAAVSSPLLIPSPAVSESTGFGPWVCRGGPLILRLDGACQGPGPARPRARFTTDG